MRISPHFHLEEFAYSKTAKEKGIYNTPSVVEIKNLTALCKNVLEPIRQHFNKPVYITSGYRSRKLNKTIGGSKYSQHLKGEAADFVVKDTSVNKVFEYIIHESIPFDQCIYEKRGKSEWIHISHKRNRKQKLIAEFNENQKPTYREI